MKYLKNKKVLYILILAIICLVPTVISTTYAAFVSSYVSEEEFVEMNLSFDVAISSIDEYQEIEVSSGQSLKFNVQIENNSTETTYYGVWYKMVNPSELPSDGSIQIGRLVDTNGTSSGEIAGGESTIASFGIVNSTNNNVIIYVGVASSTTSTSDIEYLNGKYLITGEVEVISKPGEFTLAEQIQNLYNDGSKITTVNIGGDISKPEVHLNATQGIMFDNNGEYRYYGSNPNNYVSYNDELWRIIGVSNVKNSETDMIGETRVKIIKADVLTDDNGLNTYSWDTSETTINEGGGINDWSQADIMTTLNTTYLNSTYGTCYVNYDNKTEVCSFSDTGLKDKAKKLTSNALYYLGGSLETQNLYANDYYSFERGTNVWPSTTGNTCNDGACPRAATWIGRIGLMYPSDYAYATDLSLCKETGVNYQNDTQCTSNNWLLDSKMTQWTISSFIEDPRYIFPLNSNGYMNYNAAGWPWAVRPVQYLKEEVFSYDGNGTQEDPYVITDDVNDIPIPANNPNLDNGSLIPVYYDEVAEVWKKADSSNENNSWYDYDSKMWANAVSISDGTKRTTYQSADVGTTILDSDITGFFVWIPRFKYRVWNINRQAGDEESYAYYAFTTGIDIKFEDGDASTGNVKCTYNSSNVESGTSLSDVCVYNETDTITTTSVNYNYQDAWYTHPAFTFGGEEKEGFWIGKFETTGTISSPTILPNLVSINNSANLSQKFTATKLFQDYGLSNNVEAHMLTNLEWGAVAYLTHSIYGLCDGSTCRDIYINDSENYITGRSGAISAIGVESGPYGTFDYKGYPVDYNTGEIYTDSENDLTTVATTNGNITGVYDISGGNWEIVMGNMLNSSGSFGISEAGSSWNGNATLDSKYYDIYSYGTSGTTQAAFNRARLGDAIAETTGGTESYQDAWSPGNDIIGQFSSFISNERESINFWITRGGSASDWASGAFYFSSVDGSSTLGGAFRVSIS